MFLSILWEIVIEAFPRVCFRAWKDFAPISCYSKLRQGIVKNAGFAFFLGAIVAFPGKVFSRLLFTS